MITWLAAVFAVVNGANDGGAMVASTLKVPGPRTITAVVLIGAAMVVVPLVVGTGVADTLTSGLVDAPADVRGAMIATGVVAAVVVVGALTATGLPTSLTLGMVGGIVGAGVGRGLPVMVSGMARVLLIGFAAPIVGLLLSQALARVSALVLASEGVRGMALMHWLSTATQAVAYAANDGQKMLAVLAVASIGVTVPSLIGVAVLFMVGTIAGVGAAAGTLGGQVVRASPQEEVTAQIAGSAAVLSSAALGAPVSMTQSVSGGLVGTGLLRGLRQVRWRLAGQLVLAWVITLPAAVIVGVAAARVVALAA
jgi:PiT family inorganic phosphate transporter